MNDQFDRNIDIVFWDVKHMNVPRSFEDMQILNPTARELEEAVQVVGTNVDPEQLFVLQSGGRRYWVYAYGCKILENRLDLFQTPLEFSMHLQSKESEASQRIWLRMKSGPIAEN